MPTPGPPRRSPQPLAMLLLASLTACVQPAGDSASTTLHPSTSTGATTDTSSGDRCEAAQASELYQSTIAPLLEQGQPSSCNQCHLSGVDLNLYAGNSGCATMLCMQQHGLVDLDQPDRSLVLQWITRAQPQSPLISQDVIDREYAAVLEWIEHTATCGFGTCADVEAPCGNVPSADDCAYEVGLQGAQPFDDAGDCSAKTLESMFAAKVYPWRGRCRPCHFEDWTGDLDSPRWLAVGGCAQGSLRTMRNILRDELVDLAHPRNSLLLRKPLAEEFGGVEHGGHAKFADLEDDAYRDFYLWIERYAQCNHTDQPGTHAYHAPARSQSPSD